MIIPSKELIEGSQRMVRYIESMEEDLRQIRDILNNNFPILSDQQEKIIERLDRLEAKQNVFR